MAEIAGFFGIRSCIDQSLVAVRPSTIAAWTCNVAAWVGLVARAQEPLSVMLAVTTGWCAFEGMRLRSFPLVVVSLVNTWWLLA
jgi:hypothetical protein